MIVERGTDNGEEYIYKVVDEERGEDDEGGALKLAIAESKIEHGRHRYHEVVGAIAHVEELTGYVTRQHLREEQCRLTAEELLLPLRKEVVEIRKQAVEVVGLGVP